MPDFNPFAVPSFDECHDLGAVRYRATWVRANQAAINAARGCGLDPSDARVRHVLSLIVLRVLDAVKEAS